MKKNRAGARPALFLPLAQTQPAQMHIAYFYEMDMNARAMGMGLNEGKWYVLWHVQHDD